MSSKKILMTGASGMLGQALTARLNPVYSVVGLSKSGRLKLAAVDLSDLKALQEIYDKVCPDLVIHSAAYSDVDGCENDPDLAYQANVLGTKNIVTLCEKQGCPFIHVSTDYVFNGLKSSLYQEDEEPFPINVYGMTKFLAESVVLRSSLDAVVVRTSWLFGPGNPSNFVNMIKHRLETEERVAVLADQETAPTYTLDLAEAVQIIVEDLFKRANALSGPRAKKQKRVYHVCNEGSATRYQMVLKMREIMRRSDVRVDQTDPGQIKNRVALRPRYSVMSALKIQTDFSFKLRSWQKALEDYLKKAQA